MFLKAWNKSQKVISSPLLGMGIVRDLIIWLWFLLGVQFFNGSIKDIWKKICNSAAHWWEHFENNEQQQLQK